MSTQTETDEDRYTRLLEENPRLKAECDRFHTLLCEVLTAPVNDLLKARIAAAVNGLEVPGLDAQTENQRLLRFLQQVDENMKVLDLPQYVTRNLVAAAMAGKQPPVLHVKIEILGGVAECTKCPPGVDVEIIDRDNAKESD